MRTKRIIVVGDLHVGSIYGLHPPTFDSSASAWVPQNPAQKHTWKCWLDFWDWARAAGRIDCVVVMGDVVDGEQSRQRGSEKCLATLGEQVRAAAACLKPVVRNVPLYLIQGTEYHDSTAAQAVEELAMELRVTGYQGVGAGYLSREVLDLKVNDTMLNFAHHGPGVVGLYRATGADKEGIFSALAGKEGKAIKADVVVRGHNHFFIHVEHASKHVVYCPTWQLQTRFMRKSSAYRMIPDIGGVEIRVYAGLPAGEDPVRVIKRIYPLPPLRAETLS